ncbi:MAG: hypothetical protein FWE22_08450 [Firmicutes bacterium]|nr:hypothetical protein [Bacillota bacterium]
MSLTILLTYKDDFKDCKTSSNEKSALKLVYRENKNKGLKNALIAYKQGKIFAELKEKDFDNVKAKNQDFANFEQATFAI